MPQLPERFRSMAPQDRAAIAIPHLVYEVCMFGLAAREHHEAPEGSDERDLFLTAALSHARVLARTLWGNTNPQHAEIAARDLVTSVSWTFLLAQEPAWLEPIHKLVAHLDYARDEVKRQVRGWSLRDIWADLQRPLNDLANFLEGTNATDAEKLRSAIMSVAFAMEGPRSHTGSSETYTTYFPLDPAGTD